MVILVLFLLLNTITGAIWYNKIKTEEPEMLITRYHMIAVVLIGIPIAFGAFVFIIILVVVYFLLTE